MKTVGGYGLIYLGALNAYLATHALTCMQGSAGALAGVVMSAALYAIGISLLWFGSRSRKALLALVPISWLLWEQASFAVRLAIGFLVSGTSACEALFGVPSFLDGGEAVFSVLWVGTYLGLFGGLLIVTIAGIRPGDLLPSNESGSTSP